MPMKNLRIVLLSFCFLLPALQFSQAREIEVDEDDFSMRSFKDRFYTGGNIAFQVVNNVFFLDVSPIFGYEITKNFSSGIGLKYSYIRQGGNPPWSTSIYGGSVFSRYLITANTLAHTEFEMINLDVFEIGTGFVRKWVPVWLVGGGYRQSLGGRSYFQIMLLYDIINDKNNPYQSPFGPQIPLYIRGGITIGI